MPRLGHSKQGGTDVATAQKDDRLHPFHHFVGIGAVVGVALDDVGILLQQNTHFIDIFSPNHPIVVVKSRWAQLRQNHRPAARQLNGTDDAVIGRIVRLPGDAHKHLVTCRGANRYCQRQQA